MPMIENIQTECIRRNIPFYSYRLPHTKEIVTGIQKDPFVLSLNDFDRLGENAGFVIAPFFISDKNPPLFIRKDFCITTDSPPGEELKTWLHSTCFEKEKEPSFAGYEQSQDEYLKEITDLVQTLKSSELSKVVYSRIMAVPIASEDKFKFFQTLTEAYPDAFVYCFHIPGKPVWVGATPEVFLRVSPGLLQTVSLAGTRKITDTAWNQKEYNEQEYVSRFIRDVFDSCELKNRDEEEPRPVQAGGCSHLCTRFSVHADLSASETARLINLLHPTPAVCGYPQKEAMREIQKRERHDREFYSGFLGPVSSLNQMELFVNLRCMKIGENQAELFVGGGITEDSDPQKEWDETVLKSQTLMKVIIK